MLQVTRVALNLTTYEENSSWRFPYLSQPRGDTNNLQRRKTDKKNRQKPLHAETDTVVKCDQPILSETVSQLQSDSISTSCWLFCGER